MEYQEVDAIMVRNDLGLSAAEAHGMATGMLCINDRTESTFWLGEILQNAGELNADESIFLKDLFEEIKNTLSSDEFAFELLLPDDDFPINEKVEALRQWCQGFLYGLGTSSSSSNSTAKWPQDVREAVRDITEFTKLDTNAEGEDAENDFTEITEYLKAVVIFLRTELNSADNRTVH